MAHSRTDQVVSHRKQDEATNTVASTRDIDMMSRLQARLAIAQTSSSPEHIAQPQRRKRARMHFTTQARRFCSTHLVNRRPWALAG